MKKITILAAAIAIFGLSSIDANAQSTTKPQQSQQEQNQSSGELQQGQGQSSDELQQGQGQSSDQIQQGQGQGQSSDQIQEGQAGMREVVSEDQLPEAIKRTLESEVYNDWEVEEIHKVQSSAASSQQQVEGQSSSNVVYEITMVNAEGQRGVVRLDESGKAASDE